MSFLKTFLSILGIALGLVGGVAGKAIGLGLMLIVNGGLSRRRGGGLDTSPTYGFDSLQNPTRAGGPPYLIYGRHLCAPPIISVNVSQDGPGTDQVLRLLCLVGEGEIEAIEDVRLNDVPIASYPGASHDYRLGTASQTTLTDFNQVGVAFDAGTKLTRGATHVHEMRASGDELLLNLLWPSGLYGIGSDGETFYVGGEIKIEVKRYGEGDSAYTTSGHYYGPPYWEPLNGGLYRWGAETQQAYRRQAKVKFVTAGRYVVRVTGNLDDESRYIRVPTLSSVVEVTNDARTYANRALLAIKCPPSAQLQGGVPKVTCEVKGRKVYNPVTATTAWTRNPVWILRDLLLNTRYGLGRWIDSGDLDDGVGGTWRTVAAACDASVGTPRGGSEARHEFDMVLDTKAPAREWIDQILRTCRATLVSSGGKLRLVRHASGSPLRTFSEDEGDGVRKGILATVEGDGVERSTLVERVLDDTERWNVARVAFTDREQRFRRNQVVVRDLVSTIASPFSEGSGFSAGQILLSETGTYNAVGSPISSQATCTRAVASGGTSLRVAQLDGTVPWAGMAFVTSQHGTRAKVLRLAAPAPTYPERALETQLLGVTRITQALREARYHLNMAELCPRVVTFEAFLGDLDIEPGDHIALTSTRLGYAAKQFTVSSIALRPDGRAQIEAREYDARVFEDSVDPVPPVPVGTVQTVTLPPPAVLPGPTAPLPPFLGATSVAVTKKAEVKK